MASNLGPGWRCIFRSRHIDLPEAFLSQLAQSNVVMQEKAYQVNIIHCIPFTYYCYLVIKLLKIYSIIGTRRI